MKKTIVFYLLILGICAGCSKKNKEEEQAGPLQQAAQIAYEQGRYEEALSWIDSIKRAYPKAFETRQKGVDLKNQIVIAQAWQVVAQSDSIRITLQQEIADMQKTLILVKNREYEEHGNYFYPSQVDATNSTRSYLRAQVSEDGVLTLTSVYHGSSALRHNRIRITAPDGSTVATEVGSPFQDKYGGNVTEKVDYQVEQNASEVARFVAEHAQEMLKLEFVGTRSTPVSFPQADRKGIATLYRLYEMEDSLSRLEKEKEEALVKARFYTEKVQRKGNAASLENEGK